MKMKSSIALRGLAIVLSTICLTALAETRQAVDWHVQVVEFAQKNFKHPAWGFSHSQRDYNVAKQLAQQDNVQLDDDVLFAAAYLHDMAAFPGWAKDGVDHADRAAEIVDTVLKGTNFPAEKVDTVRNAIRTHMFDRQPSGSESIYLHDADAVDWLGAIGVARILALVDPNGGQPDSHAMVGMIEKYTQDVPAHVLSPAGKSMAAQRKAESEQFIQQLKSETDGLRAL